jgi:hypothetical protein
MRKSKPDQAIMMAEPPDKPANATPAFPHFRTENQPIPATHQT